MKYLLLALALSSANFIFQAVTDQQWDVAFERSFFQCVAVACAAFS